MGCPVIGYYVHHQGRGHLQRMLTIARHLDEPVTALSSLPAPDPALAWVDLPMDNEANGFVDPTANGTLHWAPRHDPGLRRRMAIIADWIDAHDPDLMVVDVSVEVAGLSRLLGVPTVVVAMRGDRFDRAHRTAYDAADALLASWPAEFAVFDWPITWLRKTFHAGAITRFADRVPSPADNTGGSPRVLVLWGAGGAGRPDGDIEAAAAAAPEWDWQVANARADDADALWNQLSWADVVVTHGGQNAVAEVAAARRPAVIIAESRPHSEQAETVRALADAGLAVGLQGWPEPRRWPDLLESAQARGGARWDRWTSGDTAAGAAAFLDATARAVRRDTDAAGVAAAGPDPADLEHPADLEDPAEIVA
jgi:UDP-N-acetylglucosamine--N-acetylmuramyl-(pentapeptide) pyrophosphoryl-undecaprenol N-acetylglucosamine transferase